MKKKTKKTIQKTISRRDILVAIRNEPLESGRWVKMDDEDNTGERVSRDRDCPVCAVGAVLRKSGLTNGQINLFGTRLSSRGPVGTWCELNGTIKGTVRDLLKQNKYLNALSLKFEDQAERTGTGKRTRNVLTKFVKENFPKVISL